MLDEKTLRKNIRELFNAGWTNGKIADTLSAAGSFGDEFSRSEVLAIANEELDVINGRIDMENREVESLMAECIDEAFEHCPVLKKTFKRVGATVEFR